MFRYCCGPHERFLAERKQRLFRGLSGTILELGPGIGSNLPYLRPDRYLALEPNPHMHADLRRSAQQYGISPEILPGDARDIPLPDASIDVVISTLVLCSVGDRARVVQEVHRVLKPGGTFVFIEHVAAPAGSSLLRTQRKLRPYWSWCFDGCHPDADTVSVLNRGPFPNVTLEHFHAPLGPVSPHICGFARK